MTQTMAREAIAQLEQFGINHVNWLPGYPGTPVPEGVHITVTPDEMRHVPEGIEATFDLGQSARTSGMMIEIALRLSLENLLETEKFQSCFQSVEANHYSVDQMFARSIRPESLSDGVIGVNEKNEIFACNRRTEEITRTNADLIAGKRGDAGFPYGPFSRCLQEKERVPAKVIRINDVNIRVEVVPVIRQGACIGAFAIPQKFTDVEARQSELRSRLFHEGYLSLRDERPVCADIRANGGIGIPCFILEDGTITRALSEVGK